MMILCVSCHKEKDESDFRQNRASETGRQAACKDCARAYKLAHGLTKSPGWVRKTANIVAYRKKYREENRGKVVDLEKKWAEKKRRDDPEYFREKSRRKYERLQRRLHGPDWQPGSTRTKLSETEILERKAARRRRYYKIHKEKFPDRYAAKLVVKYMLSIGRLVPMPCFCCGKLPTQGHHPDYSEPLSVVWLCRSHHAQLHLEFKKYLVKG